MVDVWESRDDLDTVVGGTLAPAMQKLGISPPQVDVYPVYNLNTYAAIDRFKIS